MSKKLNSDAHAYDKEYDAFIKQLGVFHSQRGSSFKRLPRINGKGIDLYLLYVVVTARGGWQKLNSRNEWEDILEDFRLPPACVNSSTALKHIYIRYLDSYERLNFLCEDGDERTNDADEEDSRSVRTRRSIRSLNTVALTYNQQQHNVSENARISCGMCTDMFKASPYDRLALSLSCPLPNEHDFAFNMCTLLSNEGKHTLQLAQCPRLVEYMLAHTGVFKDKQTQKYFLSNYKEAKGKSLVQFWNDSIDDKAVLGLLSPDCFDPVDKARNNAPNTVVVVVQPTSSDSSDSTCTHNNNDNVASSSSTSSPPEVDSGVVVGPPPSSLPSNDPSEETNSNDSADSRSKDQRGIKNKSSLESHKPEKDVVAQEAVDLKLGPEDSEIFHLGRDLGLLDSEGTRISQVLHILRNLSFEEVNVSVLAQSNTCLRFLMLCICSRWGGLSVGALDTMGNLACEVVMKDPVIDPTSALLLTTVSQGVASQDRAFVLRSLEVLNKLAMNDPNEDILCSNINQSVYNQICRFLTIHDIMLLIYTLECLYSLSSMGPTSCNNIVRSKGSVQTLISLLTVEAQSYGPDACIGMKVVETVTGVVSDAEVKSTTATTATVTATTQSSASVTAVTTTTATTVTPINTTPATTVPIIGNSPKIISRPVSDTKKISAPRIIPVEVEEFVIDWVTKNYESCPNLAIEQGIVYRHFAASMHALGRKQGLNPVILSNCFRRVFGTGVGPNKRPSEDGTEKWHYSGIRKKDPTKNLATNTTTKQHIATPIIQLGNNIPVRVVASVTPEAAVPQQGSILKAQLSAPLRNSPSPVKIITNQQGLGVATRPPPYSTTNQMSHPPIPRTDNSSLIKSLLANKVIPSAVLPPPYPNPSLPHHIPGGNAARSYVAVSQGRSQKGGHITTITHHGGQAATAKVSRNIKIESTKTIFNGVNSENSSKSVSDPMDSKKVTSFEGILQNGIKEEEGAPLSEKKNLLADLLEKTVGGDVLNGVITKGLTVTNIQNQTICSTNINGPSNIIHGIKRCATIDSRTSPAKRLAVEDVAKLSADSRITLYVSQNGNEGEVLSQGHQVILNQGQQHVQVMSSSVLPPGSQIVNTNQGQMILQRSTNAGNVLVHQNPQVINQASSGQLSQRGTQVIAHSSSQQNQQHIITTSGGGGGSILTSHGPSQVISGGSHVLQQVISQGQGGQKVILHGGQIAQVLGGQMIIPQSGGQNFIVQGGSGLSGQVLMQTTNNQSPVILQGTNGHSQVLMQGNHHHQGQFLIHGNNSQGQLLLANQGQVTSQGQVVVTSTGGGGQTMYIASSQGQPVMVGGNQSAGSMVVSGASQGGHMLVQSGGLGNAVILPQQQGSSSGQKTIIILPNKQVVVSNQTHTGQVVLPQRVVQVVSTSNSNSSPVRTVKTISSDVFSNPVHSSPALVPAPSGPMAIPVSPSSVLSTHIPAPQVLSSGVARRPLKNMGLQYLCEWRDCNQVFGSPGQVYYHACKIHCPPHLTELVCQWNSCDSMVRKRFSAMTHINDRHCNEQLLQILALRRQQLATTNKVDIPIPQTPPPHPGYAPNAAFHAIKRHSLEVINQRDLVEKEGPVTKSIRLTAALVLRNLVIYSTSGKKLLKGYESVLANVAISSMESSRTVGQILYDIHLPDSDEAL